jgi:HAD superfamily hydrolase (TIGR01549 family)
VIRTADWLGVPRHTFSAVFGAVLARGQGYEQAFEVFRPGFDLAVEERRRAEAGVRYRIEARDLYPDARECLAALRAAGLWVGIAGNQPPWAAGELASFGLPVDFVGVSGQWGVSKPDPAFFARVVEEAPCAAGEILYVGDRVERDVVPARAAGLRTALVRRGPWAFVNAADDGGADVCLSGLAELPGWVAAVNRGVPFGTG